ncbi:hypothetical protein JHJ32_12070 [Parapedobacter sp. ISTM3]|uniref:hypothetical protein n=1 Tax=Parapedobacter sp. ISTM3 TaxID=2800130 RepID=UPI001905B5A6|nr:hypothetical protein [Parapedobacter sp. ISTM3]MBK1440727.1 hypothetical protein [Parapedobacter sp. ISTM3]
MIRSFEQQHKDREGHTGRCRGWRVMTQMSRDAAFGVKRRFCRAAAGNRRGQGYPASSAGPCAIPPPLTPHPCVIPVISRRYPTLPRQKHRKTAPQRETVGNVSGETHAGRPPGFGGVPANPEFEVRIVAGIYAMKPKLNGYAAPPTQAYGPKAAYPFR